MSEIIIIVAVAANNVIGSGNAIPWHISADWKHFKELTLGSPVIMGARTWESLPTKPLPGRRNIVLSRRGDLQLEGALVIGNLEAALEACYDSENVFIIGGGSLYTKSIEVATKIEVTRLGRSFEGDVWFPEIDPQIWSLERSAKQPDDREFGPYSYETWVRKGE